MNANDLWPASPRSWDCLRTEDRLRKVLGGVTDVQTKVQSINRKERDRSNSSDTGFLLKIPVNSREGEGNTESSFTRPRSLLTNSSMDGSERNENCALAHWSHLNSIQNMNGVRNGLKIVLPKIFTKKITKLKNLIVLRFAISYRVAMWKLHNRPHGLTSPKNHRNKKINQFTFYQKIQKKIVSINLKADIVFKQNWS